AYCLPPHSFPTRRSSDLAHLASAHPRPLRRDRRLRRVPPPRDRRSAGGLPGDRDRLQCAHRPSLGAGGAPASHPLGGRRVAAVPRTEGPDTPLLPVHVLPPPARPLRPAAVAVGEVPAAPGARA